MANTTKKVTDEKSMTLGNKTYHTGELAARQNDNNTRSYRTRHIPY